MSQLRRLCALGAVTAVTLAGLATMAGPAQATVDARPVSIGATWLEGELTSGLMHYPDTGFGAYDDYGLSIDAGLSLDAVGGYGTTVTTIRDAVAGAINHYITGEDFGDTGSTYAGPVAKAAVFAQASGGNATSFGGVNLIARLEAQVSTTAPNAGRLSDTSTFGDYANTLGQSFAANALAAASSSKAAPVIDFLLEQQCSAGFFRLSFSATAAVDQTCDASVSPSPDTDATAMAVLQLKQVSGQGQPVMDAINAAIADAESWLLSAQRADGSFGGGASTEASNTNSTGLAGWALGVLGDEAAATKAAVWVRSRQADEPTDCADALSGETGAIGYDDAAVAAGRSDGITAAALDQWRRSTAPTLPVLQWAPASGSTLSVTGPTGYVAAGSSEAYHASGAAPGAIVCLSGMGASQRFVASAAGTATTTITMPAGTADRVVTASVRAGATGSLAVQVLGATTLTVKPRHDTVQRRARIHVVVRGLAPGEHVTVRFRGHTVRTGLASASGRFVRDFRVGRKLGPAKIVAWGEFPSIRSGKTVIRVVR
jgi:hypothetical protein